MRQLVYTSKAAPGLGQDDVFQIVQTSAGKNADTGLCGFLIYQNSCFYQVLEGPADAIDTVFSRIEKDSRHSSIEVASDRQIESRHFERWRMKRIGPGSDGTEQALDEMNGQLKSAGIKHSVEQFLSDNR